MTVELVDKINSNTLELLNVGQTTIIPCKSNLALTQSKIQSLYKNKALKGKKFTQKKALIVIDETCLPMPIVLVTRNQ